MVTATAVAAANSLRVRPTAAPNWLQVEAEDALRTPPPALLPGWRTTPAGLLVARNLVVARPDLFTILAAPAVPQRPCNAVNVSLRPYQTQVLEFAAERESIGLAWAVGVGKTRAAAAIATQYGRGPVLIVGPLRARSAWTSDRADPKRLFGWDVRALEGRKDTHPAAFEGADVVFCHYDILEAWAPWFLTYLRPKVLIGDEVHNLKNPRAQVTRAALSLARLASIELRVALSGTPVLNEAMDLWPFLQFVAPDAFGDRVAFGLRHAGGRRGSYGWEYEGVTHVGELDLRLRDVLHRVTRQEALPFLPPITRQVVETPVDDAFTVEYEQAWRNVREYAQARGGHVAAGAEALQQMTALCSILSQAKVATSVAQATEVLTAHRKIVVFTWFRTAVHRIATALAHAFSADEAFAVFHATGSESASVRAERATRFLDHDGRAAFVATIGSCGEGINELVCADCVVFNDLYWVPARILQAEGRLWRSGQAHPVHAYYVVCKGTVDEAMIDALLTKAEVVDAAGIPDDSTALAADLDRVRRRESESTGLSQLFAAVAALDSRELETY